jgi:hypothetical protein
VSYCNNTKSKHNNKHERRLIMKQAAGTFSHWKALGAVCAAAGVCSMIMWWSTTGSTAESPVRSTKAMTDAEFLEYVNRVDQENIRQNAFLVPKGAIIMWSGTTPPTNWALCDGQNGTPNLRDRFIIGAGGRRQAGNQGGSASHNHGPGDLRTEGHGHSIPWQFPANGEGSNFIEEGRGRPDLNRPGSVADVGALRVTGGETASAGHLPPFYALAFIIKL